MKLKLIIKLFTFITFLIKIYQNIKILYNQIFLMSLDIYAKYNI